MSRPRMVTRTFKRTNVKFVAFNEKLLKGEEKTFVLMGSYKTDNEILTALREQYTGKDTPIKVISHKTERCLMGMYEKDFYTQAVEVVDRNTNKIKETKTTKRTNTTNKRRRK